MTPVTPNSYVAYARTAARGVVRCGGAWLGASLITLPAGLVGMGIVLRSYHTLPADRWISYEATKVLTACGFYVVVFSGGYVGDRIAKKVADFVLGTNQIRANLEE